MKLFLCSCFVFCTLYSFSQKINKTINAAAVEKIERVLAADDMQGRAVFTPGIDKAAAFISNQFKKAGLETLNGNQNYLQSFYMLKPSQESLAATTGGATIDPGNIIIITAQKDLNINESADYQKVTIAKGENLFRKANGYIQEKKNYVVFVDTSFRKVFSRMQFFTAQITPSPASVIFLLTPEKPASFNVQAKHHFDTLKLANVTGVLPGKTKPEEIVIFSSHYDHLGIEEPVNGDSIYNGANDDASGTTAVIMLARHFKKAGNNERTIIFAAFTGEESGGFGSKYFSEQLDPSKVMAMFNIEMIGTESKWGTGSAYITGYEKTDMGKILQQNLAGTGFTFYPDPYTEQNLFYRSDNATLARLGVPAHTISTSKMDSEPNYHRPSDEIGTLDMKNMAEIIKSIALSAAGIINGKDTPTRVDTSELK